MRLLPLAGIGLALLVTCACEGHAAPTPSDVPATAAAAPCLTSSMPGRVVAASDLWPGQDKTSEGAERVTRAAGASCPTSAPTPAACPAMFPFGAGTFDAQWGSAFGAGTSAVVQGFASGAPAGSSGHREVRYAIASGSAPTFPATVDAYVHACGHPATWGSVSGTAVPVKSPTGATVTGLMTRVGGRPVWVELDGDAWPDAERDRVVPLVVAQLTR